MNISHKYLINNSLSNDKIQYYQKIVSKYIIAQTKIQKNKKLLNNYRKYILDWLFSFDLETRMIICCVENKRYTNIMNKLYMSHKDNKNTKFIIKDEKDETSNSKDNENISFFYSESNDESPQNLIFDGFLHEIKFYQCESSIKNLENYSNYFTLSESVLTNQTLFINYFSKISNEKYFTSPITIYHDSSSKLSYLQLPNWICNNNTQNNMATYFTINEYFCGLFEQVISVRFITSYNMKNIDEILSSCYLKDIFNKSKIIINYLNRINEDKFYYFKIDELIEEMYNNQELDNFIQKYSNNEDIDNFCGWFVNSLYYNKNHILEEIKSDINKFFQLNKNSNENLINMISMININKLFTYDDFLFRGIFERIYNDYTQKIVDDLNNDDDFSKGNKKKNKKKKMKQKKKEKKKEEEEIFFKEQILSFVKNLILEFVNNSVEKSFEKERNNYINHLTNNINNNHSKKRKKKLKENKFFLYETVKKDKKYNSEKKNLSLNTLNVNLDINEETEINIEDNNLNIEETNKNYIQKEKDDEEFISPKNKNKISSLSEIKIEKFNYNNNINYLSTIPSHINSLTISSSNNSSTSGESTKNNQINIFNSNTNFNNNNYLNNNNILNDNQFLLHHNPLISLFDNLNNDITIYFSEQEIILNYLHEIKNIIYEFLSEITNKIYPNSKLEIYGSSLYKLDIECSDLDLCITSEEQIFLPLLITELKNNYNEIFEKIFPIPSASVPVLKLIINPFNLKNKEINSIYGKIHSNEYYINYIFDKIEINKIRIDITINSINYNQIIFIQNSLLNYPSMIYVIKILKRCLYEKNMNQTYKGGMSSYVLFLLVYSFTKWNVIINNKIDSPGELLIDFLFYYIMVIDFNQTLINANLNNPFRICYNLDTIPTILDPVTMNNAAKSVFKIFNVVKIFNFIYSDIYIINKNINEKNVKENKKNIIKILFENLMVKNNNH